MKDQSHAPLFAALREYATGADAALGFHSPGHKQGRGTHPGLLEYLGPNVFGIDITVLPYLDFLSDPRGPIRQAQELAAAAWGAERAWFLINGTSCGIHTMIAAAAGPGQKVILPRNVHKSALAALIITGAEPVYLQPEFEPDFGVPLQVRPQQVEEALARHGSVAAVVMIHPTYYGVATDLAQIVQLSHRHGVPVLVDEAHGAHFRWHDGLPPSAMQAGADMSAASTHKIAGSMTQSAMLFAQGSRVDPHRIQATLNMLQTTSPSFVLMASLDAARSHMALHGEQLIRDAIYLSRQSRDRIEAHPRLYTLGPEVIGWPSVFDSDPTKVVIHVGRTGLTGFQAEEWLAQAHDVHIELSGERIILIPITLGDDEERVERFTQALFRVVQEHAGPDRARPPVAEPPLPPLALTPRAAHYAPHRRVAFDQAAGQVAAEQILVYPPGVPLLCPGERITAEVMDYLAQVRAQTRIQGASDPSLATVSVVA